MDGTKLDSALFRIARDCHTYPGVFITGKPGQLLEGSWNLKIKQLNQNIEFWNTHLLSLVGRIKAMIMWYNVIPYNAIPHSTRHFRK